MKVIIIKDCKDGKINDIVDVSDGYAKNFLIRNGFATAINSVTAGARTKNIKNAQEAEAKAIANAEKVKAKIESLTLSFALKTTNMVVHGSITRKQIIKSLKENGVTVDNHAVDNVKIESLGITNVNIKLHKKVSAKVKVEVKNG